MIRMSVLYRWFSLALISSTLALSAGVLSAEEGDIYVPQNKLLTNGQEQQGKKADRLRYGPTDGKDTLWNIAKQYSTDNSLASISKMMHEIYKYNKSAFLNGDIDILMRGHVLQIPTIKTEATSTKAEAKVKPPLKPSEKAAAAAKLAAKPNPELEKKLSDLSEQITELTSAFKSYKEETDSKVSNIETLKVDNNKNKSDLKTVESQLESMYSMLTSSVSSLKTISAKMSENALKSQSIISGGEGWTKLFRQKAVIYSMAALVLLLVITLIMLRTRQSGGKAASSDNNNNPVEAEKKVEPVIEEELVVQKASGPIELESPLGAKTYISEPEPEPEPVRHVEIEDPLAEVEKCKSYKDYSKAEQTLLKALQSAPFDHELHLALFNLYVETNDKNAFKKRFEEIYDFIGSDRFFRESVYNMWKVAWPETSALKKKVEAPKEPPPLPKSTMLSPELAKLAELAKETTQEPIIAASKREQKPAVQEKNLNNSVMLQKAKDFIANNNFEQAEKTLNSIIRAGDGSQVVQAKEMLTRIKQNSRIMQQLNRKTFGRDSDGMQGLH